MENPQRMRKVAMSFEFHGNIFVVTACLLLLDGPVRPFDLSKT